MVLDGDEMRETISTHEDLSPEGRRSHNLRVARLASLLSKQGMIVLVCVIAPFEAARKEATEICSPHWIYVKRDGLDAPDRPYEPPANPELTLNHDTMTKEESLIALEEFVRSYL